MPVDRPTFSNAWSRVNQLTPTLRPHVQIKRQLYRGHPWHVIHDPVTNSFFRLNPVSYYFVSMLDGQRSVDDVWRLTLDRHGDDAPTQHEVIGLLSQLNQSNLLRVDLPVDAQPLLERSRTRTLKTWGGRATNILFLQIPLFNPNRMLDWLEPIVRPLLSKAGLIFWFLWVSYALYRFLPNFGDFLYDAQSVLAPANWGWMILLFLLTKAFHELGHGLVCKRFKGSVPEMGIMMLVLFPAPYVDATSSWNMPNKWHRLLVGSAGMMFELVIAGAAALAWLNFEKGSLPSQLAYNTVFLASVTTILFNANPLLRFDGYYILSDLLEIPNLYERSTNHLKYLCMRYLFGLTRVPPVSTLRFDQTVMVVYGIASQIYRGLIMLGIAFFVASAIPLLGLIVAAWSIISWALIPVGKFIHWLATSQQLYEHRLRAVGVSGALAFSLIIALGLVRAPEHRWAQGIVESTNTSDVIANADGFVTQVFFQRGEPVKKGDLLMILDNPQLRAKEAQLRAQMDYLAIERRAALTNGDTNNLRTVEAKITPTQAELQEVQQRLTALRMTAPRDGVLIGSINRNMVGIYLKRGTTVGSVEDLTDLRVTAMVDQTTNDFALIDQIATVELRTTGQADQVHTSEVTYRSRSGRQKLPHPALGYRGGGTIALAPNDKDGTTSLRPMFEMWLALPSIASAHESMVYWPGERVYVRFTLKNGRPLLFQWAHRARQILRNRLPDLPIF